MELQPPVYINYGVGRFLTMLQQFGQFVQTVPLQSFSRTVVCSPVGIIVSPRNNSGIPFCNLAVALLYAARGYPVTIIWDDLAFLDPEWDTQFRSVDMLVKAICKHSVIDYVQLSTLDEAPLDANDREYLRRIASNNAVWNVRNIVPTEELGTYAKLSFEAMCTNAGRIKQLYATRTFDHCVHQSLLNNNGGVHKYFANMYGMRLSCLDVSNGRGMIGLDNVQGYFYDVLPLIDEKSPFFLFGDEEATNIAIQKAREDHTLRLQGKDDRSTQPGYEQGQPANQYDVVIPLNIFWDTSALGRNRLFESPYDWLVNTLSFILFQTPHSVALRQHPHESTFKQFKTGTLLGEALCARFKGHPRFRFIASEEKVNTYQLIEQASVVLPYTSTLGIEAAMMDRRVIVESDVYYADQPFVHKALTIEDYFNQIKQAQPVSFSEEEKTTGWLLYFLVTQTPFLHIPFGLDPVDIAGWTTAGFEALHTHSVMDTAIAALANNTPYSYFSARRILDEALARKIAVNEPDLTYHS